MTHLIGSVPSPNEMTVREWKESYFSQKGKMVNIHLADGSVAPDDMTLGEVRLTYGSVDRN